MIRVLLILFSFIFLTGCIQGAAMLGPVISVAQQEVSKKRLFLRELIMVLKEVQVKVLLNMPLAH